MFQRSAFCLTNAFHAEPHRGALPNVLMLGRGDRPPVGIHPQIAAADEVEAGVVEVVVGPVVDGDALRRQAVPVVQVAREQRGDAGALVVAEVVPADLAVVVRQAVGIGLRFRQQQQAHVLVDIAGDAAPRPPAGNTPCRL